MTRTFGVVLLFAFTVATRAQAADPPESLHPDECVISSSAPQPPNYGFSVSFPPCLVPRWSPVAAVAANDNRRLLAVPLSEEKKGPPPAPIVEQPGLIPILAANGALLRSDLSLPVLNLVGRTLLPKTFPKFVSLEKDWRTSQGLLRLHANIGRVHPFVEGSMIVVDGRIINLLLSDPNPSPVLREDRRVSELLFLGAARSPYWFGGVIIDLGKGFAVGIGGTALYVDRPFYAGALILTVPLAPQR